MILMMVDVVIPKIQIVNSVHLIIYELPLVVNTAGRARRGYSKEWRNYLATILQMVAVERPLQSQKNGLKKLKMLSRSKRYKFKIQLCAEANFDSVDDHYGSIILAV